MLNVFFIFSQAKKDEDNFKKYASKSEEEKQRMYQKFDVHTKYFVDKGFSFTNPPEYSSGHRKVAKVAIKVPLMARFLSQPSTSAQKEDCDPDDPSRNNDSDDDSNDDSVSNVQNQEDSQIDNDRDDQF